MPFPDGADLDAPTDLDRLQVAFAVQVARNIVDADGFLDMDEVELLCLVFPNDWMRALGFIDENTELTPAVGQWYQRSLRELPRRLDHDQKLNLVTLFHRTCVADGQLHHRELSILMDAAKKLHLPRDHVKVHISMLKGGGTLVPFVRE